MTDTIKPAAIERLAAKLDTLSLTADERALLDTLIERAADADVDVEGFGVVFEVETTLKSSEPPIEPSSSAARVGRAVGMTLSPLGVWTDMRPSG